MVPSRMLDVASIAAEIRELIDLVIVDQVSWEDVARRLGERVPGSFVALIGQSERRQSLNHMSTFNLDPQSLRSFAENYAQINPWNPNWSAMKSGDILISEDMAPARLFHKGAFYEEWLKPLGRFDAGAGLQIRHGGSDRIYLTVHYDPALHGDYGPALEGIYRAIRGHLDRAALLAEKLAESNETVVAKAALLGHGVDCAFIVDEDLQIEDANPQAQSALSQGRFLSSHAGKLRIGGTADTASVRQMLSALVSGGLDDTRRYLQSSEGAWLLRLFCLPADGLNFASIFRRRRLFLLIARDLTASADNPAVQDFSAAFRLTAAERSLCAVLVEGATIERAAEILGIARDTARQRLKTIFRKTDTHRQSQLISLLIRAH
ncbi:DNA-binding CsgD family transcriptional regulator [Rhizobium sp. SG_E_25_P2]|uniref:helix-turn-helix transcriptional regulator n=1 Tax=Rhizobium sp. SG_E_25_P2 TaxID=2879942 RepID=UPI0024766B91|nr:helix-turn-helix transcriptional regulator [Rhizobium sp. SG_E_25_P2]MDH6269049.1 DNA-binding CsgD family transcriptional regulator [Rhizobium sp. SG_E_25_P2]